MSGSQTTDVFLEAAIKRELGSLRHHLLAASGCACLLLGKAPAADAVAQHIKAALEALAKDGDDGNAA